MALLGRKRETFFPKNRKDARIRRRINKTNHTANILVKEMPEMTNEEASAGGCQSMGGLDGRMKEESDFPLQQLAT